MRYLCIDFETNGRPNDWVLPCGAFPTQVSVTACVPATREMTHLYDSQQSQTQAKAMVGTHEFYTVFLWIEK